MEEECVTGLYKSLGVSVGAEFSPEDLCVLFHKVLHQPSSQEDALAATRRVAGEDDSWSCSGRNVLDVLLEMETERGRRQELYWDLQLLSVGTKTHPSTFTPETHATSSDRDDRSERGRLAGDREQGESSIGWMWRLRRTARQCWARLVAGGVCSVLPSLSQGEMSESVEGTWAGVHTLRCVSVSELHLLVEVKYDTVTHTLCTEMLQENLGQNKWENLLPWQREERAAELGERIEEALETGDLLRLCDLPGAFRIYRSHEGVSSKSCPDSIKPRVEFWTAISLLAKIQAFQQDEKKELTTLSKRLDQPALQLLSLYVRLATVRAQRELQSPGALLAAWQAWQAWPSVRSPGITEQARLLLQERGEEGNAVEPSPWVSSQQSVLYYMVLSQEQERRYLLRLLHGVSLEDLQGLGGQNSPGEVLTQQREVALREACVRKMKHTHAILQTHTQTQSPQGSPILQLQHQSQTAKMQTQDQAHIQTQDQTHLQTQGQTHMQTQGQTHLQTQGQTQDQNQSLELVGPSSQFQWGACALVLLTKLMELQESQVSAVLPSLVDMREQHLLALRKDHECDLKNPRLNCLLTLLTLDAPPISSTLLPPDPCPEPFPPIPAQNNVTDAILEQRAMDGNQVHPDGRRETQDVCTGCGETFEDLPYLEILCVPPTVGSSNTHQASSHTSTEGESAHGLESAHGGLKVGQEGSTTKTPQIFEKQDSLITLAWSKPSEAAATDVRAAAMEQESFCSVQGASPCATRDTPGHSVGDTRPLEEAGRGARQLEVLDSSLFQSSCKAGPGPRQTEGHNVDMGQRESATAEGDQALRTPLETGEAGCDVDLYTHTPVTHTETTGAVDVARTHSPPEEKAGMSGVPMEEESNDDILAAAPNEFAYLGAVGGQPAEQEVCHLATEPWTQSGLDQSPVDQVQSRVPESARMQESMLERERTREPVSVMERERTMRSLVDMHKKVEQKQQRDRDRQLLRVQERLSIIQNRKSEEDLMGLKQKDRLRHLTHNLPLEDKSQQNTVVRERLEQVRRERSYVMQSKRDRNTAGFKELLAPVVLQGTETEEGAD